jgi:flagellar M-ring protein FliF
VALLIVFTLVRPALKAATAASAAPAQAERLHVVADEPLQRSTPALAAPRSAERLEGARAAAKQNPAAVANIVREWVKADGS